MKLMSLILLSSGILISYNEINAATSSSISKKVNVVERNIDPVQYSRGARLFQLNCAICHGKYGEGAKTGDIRIKMEKIQRPH
mgnify:CR=1 FL=1